ncbi:MAG: hypothetical protein H6810_00995 [Phycisphaeraceae bacterium]|nr:MAG: hypothetical protein H6810_00995 [Phycisphaeraceae bacterium]
MTVPLSIICLPALALAGPSGTSARWSGGVAHAVRPELHSAVFVQPTKDTSTYSNIGASGNTRPYVWMSTFPDEGRQSNLVAMFNTGAAGVPTGPDAARIRIIRMVFTACTYPAGPRAIYDPSPDPWQNTLWAGGDIIVYDVWGGSTPVGSEYVPAEPRYVSLGPAEDGNKPVELFGVKYNNGWSAASWVETGTGTPAYTDGVYNAEPIDFDDNGVERSVLFSPGESAVEFVFGLYVGDDGQTYDTYYPTGNFLPDPVDGFDPNVFALGKSYFIPDGTPGHSVGGQGQDPISLGDEIPPAHRLRFDVRVDDPAIQRYLRSGLEAGWISLMASQLAYADIGLNGSYSYWLTKEGSATLPPVFDLDPCTLEFDYLTLPPGDFNGDGLVDRGDFGPALMALTDPAGFERAFGLLDAAALTDMDSDGDTDLADVTAIARLLAGL